MKANTFVYDVGSTYTKLSAFTVNKGEINFIARTQVPTTIDDIGKGFQNARRNIEKADGCEISKEVMIFSSSSAAGGLRMVALGYMPRVTAKAAKEVAMSAGARVLEIISQEDQVEFRIQVLREIKPDIILLAGGTDGGDKDSLIENAQNIVKAEVKSVVIIAGNKNAQPEVERILKANSIETIRVPNVMPNIHELIAKPAREAIHGQFIKQITKAKGLKKMTSQISNNKVIPTPGAVLLAAELLAKGTHKEEGVGDVLVIDVGGATTDVHSVLPELEKLSIEERGLLVNNEKQTTYRTVEGNLGLRVSATGIIDTVGPEGALAKVDKKGDDLEEKIVEYAHFLERNTEHVGKTELEKEFDIALAISAIEIALKRHAGYIARNFDPLMGVAPGTPVGRDLRKVKYVIAVGGIFAYSSPEIRRYVLEKAFKNPGISLLPEVPCFVFDDKYIMYAIGVLAQEYPDMTLRFAKKYFKLEEESE